MRFEDNSSVKNVGKKIGFFLALLLFLSILYFILSLLNKLPAYIIYNYVLIIAIILYVFKLLYMAIKK